MWLNVSFTGTERVREDDISRREMPRSSEFETVGKIIEKFPHHCSTEAQFFGGCVRVHHPFNFPARREAGYYRHMSLLSLLRAAVGLNPRKSKPVPIREPNAPPKPIRDDKREKKEKKPVVQTEDNQEEEVTRLQSAMMDERGNPVSEENFLRTEWGVRIKDQARKVDPQEDLVETIEKPFYVIKPLWGVNVKHFKTRDEVPLANTEVSNPDATSERDFNHSVSPPKASPSNVSSASPGPTLIRDEQSEAKSKVSKAGEHPSVPSSEISAVEQKVSEKLSQDKSLTDAAASDEVQAWKMVIEKSKDFQKKQQELETSRQAAAAVSSMFLQPEPPEPKLDFAAIPPIRKINGSSGVTEKSKDEEKRPVGGNKPSGKLSNVDDAMSKKLHTSSGFASNFTKISDYRNVPSKKSIVDLEQLLFTNLSLKTTSGSKRTVDIKTKENILNVSLSSSGNYVSSQ